MSDKIIETSACAEAQQTLFTEQGTMEGNEPTELVEKKEVKRKRRTNAEMEASREAQELALVAARKAEMIRTLLECEDSTGVKTLPLDVKLHRIRREIDCPKNMEVNTMGNDQSWRFRTLGHIFERLMPLLDRFGCTIDINEDIVPVVNGDVYVKATIEVIDLYADNRKKTFCGYARETRNSEASKSEQLTGRALNYAKKEALSAMLCFNSSRDADEVKDATTPVGETNGIVHDSTPETVQETRKKPEPAKPRFKCDGPLYDEEVKRLKAWTGTRDEYEKALKERFDILDLEMIKFITINRREDFQAA